MPQERPEDLASEAAAREALQAAQKGAADRISGARKGVEIIDSDRAKLIVAVPRGFRVWKVIVGLGGAGYLSYSVLGSKMFWSGNPVHNAVELFRAQPSYWGLLVFVLIFLALGLQGLRSVIFGEQYVFDLSKRVVYRGFSTLAQFDDVEAVEVQIVGFVNDNYSHVIWLSLKNGKKIMVLSVTWSGGLREAAEKMGKHMGVPVRVLQ